MTRACNRLTKSQLLAVKVLNKLPVSHVAELSNCSKAYISQVKSGKRAASSKLIKAIEAYLQSKKPQVDYISLFIQSREARGCTLKTVSFYKSILNMFSANFDYRKVKLCSIERFLNNIKASNNNLGNRHAYYRALRVFYNWLSAEYGFNNVMQGISAPRLSKVILPSLTAEQVNQLINASSDTRDKAIIALFTESGLRLSELAAIKEADTNWDNMTIRVFGKGNKEAHAPFGQQSKRYLEEWLNQYDCNGNNIWGISKWGIVLMLKRLEEKTGLSCSPHAFSRTFACLLRKAGVDSLTIKELGRWESLAMVERYTRSFGFDESLKFYIPPLS